MDDKLRHLGIIPDGIRRWARQNNTNLFDAYWMASNKLANVIEWAFEGEVQIQSVYLLSKENLGRSPQELEYILAAEKKFFSELLMKISKKWNCEFAHAGTTKGLPQDFVDALLDVCNKSQRRQNENFRKVYLLVAYDPWDEIFAAVSKARNPRDIPSNMWVQESVDLIIRTGFGQLVSNFLPLQSGYAEFEFLSMLFNDIEKNDITKVIKNFPKHKKRLLGK